MIFKLRLHGGYDTANFKQKTGELPAPRIAARRIDDRESLTAELNELESYCLTIKKRRSSPKTVLAWRHMISAIFTRMEYLEYSRDYILKVERVLEAEERPTGTIFIYLTALQELFRANHDDKFYISRPKVTFDTTDDAHKYHSPEEIEKLIKSINTSDIYGVRDVAIVKLLYFSAIRNSELVHLTLKDYDPRNKFITIREHGTWHPKNYQTRKLNIPDTCNDSIKLWLQHKESTGTTLPYLFITADLEMCQETTIRQMVHRRSDDIDMDTYPHKLRHSRCSHLANGINGNKPWPLPILSKFMGHSSLEITSRYIHSNDEDQKKCLIDTKEIDV